MANHQGPRNWIFARMQGRLGEVLFIKKKSEKAVQQINAGLIKFYSLASFSGLLTYLLLTSFSATTPTSLPILVT